MKKLVLLALLLSFTLNLKSQEPPEGMVLIEMDSIFEATKKEFINTMEHSNVDYEAALRKIRGVKIVDRDRTFVSEFKGGYIILNKRLNDFPYTKRAVILQELGINNGLKLDEGDNANVMQLFNVTGDTENKFRKQNKYGSTLYKLKKELEEISPIKRKR